MCTVHHMEGKKGLNKRLTFTESKFQFREPYVSHMNITVLIIKIQIKKFVLCLMNLVKNIMKCRTFKLFVENIENKFWLLSLNLI